MATWICYLALLNYAGGVPTPTSSDPTHSTTTSTAVADGDVVFNTQYRSTIEIVWSCLTIIFACSWLCVHPNVTGYRATLWQRVGERFKMFVLAIFCPELLAIFAFYQWKGCRELHRDFNERAEGLGISHKLYPNEPPKKPGRLATTWNRMAQQLRPLVKIMPAYSQLGDDETAWTLTHAHFVQMGGIVFKQGEEVGFKNPKDWTDDDLRAFFGLGLSEGDISDKSKASTLAKGLVLFQVLWFVVQTSARAAQGLPITQLEVVCLTFTAFNVAMYVFWWGKPLDVEQPLVVEGLHGGDSPYDMWDLVGVFFGLHDSIPIGAWIYSSEQREYPRLYYYGRLHDFQDDIRKSGVFGPRRGFTLALSFTSMALGALHTIGWFLPTPSVAESLLWRISCLVLLLYPILCFVLMFLWLALEKGASWCGWPDEDDWPWPFQACGYFIAFISLLGFLAYTACRVILLVLPFIELRALPRLAHKTISWSNFLPHV